MRIALILIVLMFCSFLPQQKLSKDTLIYWSGSRPLTWTDFESRHHGMGDEAAASAVVIHSSFNSKPAQMIITCLFDKTKSWVWMEKESEALLKHEQGHFDITEIFARKYRKEAMAATFTIKNIQDKYTKLHNDINSKWGKEENLYDKETNHGLDTAKQSEWLKNISTQLDELKEYTDTLVHIQL
jgi:hypothetical protein